jgi:glycosyltransferase involved in cell wall biosynthesis
MRILLAQNSLYYPAHGGGDKSNRLLLEALAARGHECRVVARTAGVGANEEEGLLHALEQRSVAVRSRADGVVVFERLGVEAHVLANHPHLRSYFTAQIDAFRPDVILASTDDPAQLLLEAALRAAGPRVIYLVRATLAVPFGPDCAFPSESRTMVLRQVDGTVGVSQYVADYVRRWSGIEAIHVPISLIEPGPYAELGRFDNEFVTLVNPCAVKGLPIFLSLAECNPDLRFAAIPTWGTSSQDRAALGRHANIRVLDPVDDIDRILERTRVLLVPSLWAEARSRIVLEAMLRGVPVMASNVGGIPEAKMGVDYLLPVRPIAHYQTRLDEQMVPIADVPPQEIGPWQHALAALTRDRGQWERVARESRQAALAYVAELNVQPFESFLETVRSSPRRARAETAPPVASALDQMSPEKKRLLALRLHKANLARWFPTAGGAGGAARRLFCFPHAGGGASAFARWERMLPAGVAVCPAQLPGRESRVSEPPLADMGALVQALAEAIQPHLGRPFAFFGHSMGAVVAFELAVYLR